jgi:hypothetical protein
LPHLPAERWKGFPQDRRASDHDEGGPCRRDIARCAKRLPQSSARAVTLDRQLELAAHREADTCGLIRFSPQHDERRTIDPLAPLEERLKLGAGGQSLTSRKAATQTVSRLRPLARRRFNTFRPPLVFMRSRNPCVLARRRRLG